MTWTEHVGVRDCSSCCFGQPLDVYYISFHLLDDGRRALARPAPKRRAQLLARVRNLAGRRARPRHAVDAAHPAVAVALAGDVHGGERVGRGLLLRDAQGRPQRVDAAGRLWSCWLWIRC